MKQKRPEIGERIELTDTRGKKRPILLWPEQKRWFWPLTGTTFSLGIGLMVMILAGGMRFRAVSCGIIATGLAGGICFFIRQSRLEHFRFMRASRRAQRVEKEIERFNIVLLRGLRLPLRNIRQAADKIRTPFYSLTSSCVEQTTCQDRLSFEKGNYGKEIAVIQEGVEEMDALAAGMLRMARARRAQLRTDWVDVNSIVVGVVHKLDPLVQQSGATIHMQHLPTCLADSDLISQLFEALISNALQYSGDNQNAQIRIWGWIERNKTVYCVQDNGIGMDSDEIDKIFEMFYRVRPDRTTKQQGLGLAVVRRVVEQHNGRLWVKSIPGRGSTFTFSLPMK
ncbi:MAG: HAMP domain-containing histidine kinase [Sedimentisphaerales bacterium]|nr:HAMP domain-containing histidine kinase [Sedimentisphaerales bacterium]